MKEPRSAPSLLRSHSRTRILATAVAAIWLFAGAEPVQAAEQTLFGGSFAQFSNKPGNERDKMRVAFKNDFSLIEPLPDPTTDTATLTVLALRRNATQAEVLVNAVVLNKNFWRERLEGADYLYRDKELSQAGVQKIQFYAAPNGGGLVLKAKGPRYGSNPVRGPVAWVDVKLTIGTTSYCGRFSPVHSFGKRNDSARVQFVGGSGRCENIDPPPTTTSSTTSSTTTTTSSTSSTTSTTLPPVSGNRVPAEWEEQEAVWLQWPGPYEKTYEPAFAEMSVIISAYQKLHILYDNNTIRNQARTAIINAGGNPDDANIFWHRIANDNAWMRDNGPTYVVQDGGLRIQDWRFDAWGGGFGNNIPYAADDAVPTQVGPLVGMPVDHVEIVHERGNLEFNGSDAVILNWSVIGDPERNPGYTKAQAIADMEYYFGVSRVVLIEGYVPNDFTRGHVDGIARFIDPDTVVVGQCTSASLCQPGDSEAAVYDDAAARISEAGFTVLREPFEGRARYNGGPWFDIDYMNWLVGNGFVIAVGFENPTTNAAAKQRLESYYPGRDVYIVDMLASWDAGGGAHCHTNDQPAASTVAGYTPWTP